MKKSDFEYVLSLLRQYAGWDLSNDKYFIIDKKLYNFICEKGYASVEDLIAELKIGQKAMLWQVVEALTLSDTYFYRDYPVLSAAAAAGNQPQFQKAADMEPRLFDRTGGIFDCHGG